MRLKDADIRSVNTVIEVTALVKDLIEKKTVKNDVYLDVVLSDMNRQITCKYFNVNTGNVNIEVGNVVEVKIRVTEYNGNPSYLISESRVIPCSPSDYIAWFEKLPQLKVEFNKLVSQISNPVYKKVLDCLLEKVNPDFESVPAAKSMHHTEFGGCLAHCALVALNAFRVSQIYNSVYSKERPFLDIELVITGSLIHDMGKVVEFEWDALEGAMAYSDNIDSVDTHITLIGEWLTEIAIANGFKDNESYRLLRHCVLSHHGLLEFGSPVVPAIPEAYIISVCDKMDASIWGYSNSMSDLEYGESKYCRVGGELKRIYNRK